MNNKIKVILALTILLSAVFYWFELRPAMIKNDCAQKVSPSEGIESLDKLIVPEGMTKYEYCLHINGL